MTATGTAPWLPLCLLIAGVQLAAVEDLVFDQASATVTPPIEQGGTLVSFGFIVNAEAGVEITDYSLPCACVTVSADKGRFAREERGQLDVYLDFEDRVGAIEKRIAVFTRRDGVAALAKQTLTIRADVQSPLAFSADALTWPSRSDAEAKTVVVRPKPGFAVSDLSLLEPERCKYISVTSRTIDDALEIRVRPESTDRKALSYSGENGLRLVYLVEYAYGDKKVKKRQRLLVSVAMDRS
ncbi:MAG: DUF1573 domain-containing protein [Planctomycetes bacterium]|nr:DUF1573 domain-containing protein [Planctomycetota bacterium]